jgi:hypothetical protein
MKAWKYALPAVPVAIVSVLGVWTTRVVRVIAPDAVWVVRAMNRLVYILRTRSDSLAAIRWLVDTIQTWWYILPRILLEYLDYVAQKAHLTRSDWTMVVSIVIGSLAAILLISTIVKNRVKPNIHPTS